MKAVEEPTEVERLTRLNEYGADDLFICCANFEGRFVSCTLGMSADFRTRFAVVFVIEEPPCKKQVDNNRFRLQSELGKRRGEGAYVISYPNGGTKAPRFDPLSRLHTPLGCRLKSFRFIRPSIIPNTLCTKNRNIM